MYDTNGRSIIVNRMNEERVAQARRDHLLRAAREERDAYEVKAPVVAPSLRTTLASALGSARHGLTNHSGRRVHGTAAR
jgi:hypothetical protein